MIRGRRPQAYNASTKEKDSLLIPAASIDFPDKQDLETKMGVVTGDIDSLKRQANLLDDAVNKPLSVPKQLGTVTYNGEVQAPVWDIQTSRITISGDTTGTDAGTYNVTFTLINGSWEDETLLQEQPAQWTISKKRIPKPFVNGVLIEDGTLQNVQLCDFNSKYCVMEGQVQGRSAGPYNVSVKIVNPNVVWDDNTTGNLLLTWRIVAVINSSASDNAIATLAGTVNSLQSALSTLAGTVADNTRNITTLMTNSSTATESCSCSNTFELLKGRIEILEAFMGFGGEISDVAAAITVLLRSVIRLENSVQDMSDEDLEVETTILSNRIDETLAKATAQSDIDTLENLKVRVQNVIKLKHLLNDIDDIQHDISNKTDEVRSIINNDGDLDSAKDKVKSIEDDLTDILNRYDSDTKDKVDTIIRDLQDQLVQLKTDIAKKEVQKVMANIETNITTIRQKIDGNEDPSDVISQTEDLIDTAEKIAEPYKMPFEKDQLTSFKDTLEDLKKEYLVVQKMAQLDRDIKDLNTNSYTDEQVNSKINSADETLQQINELKSDLGTNKYDTKIQMLQDDLADVKDAFWVRQKETELGNVRGQLENIKAAIESADVDKDDLTQWNTDIANLGNQLDDIKNEASTKNVTLPTLSEVQTMFDSTKESLRAAIAQRTINSVDRRLDQLRESIDDNTITYDNVNSALDSIDLEIAEIDSSNPPSSVTSSFNSIKAKVNLLRQLNEDIKIYREVKPVLNAAKARIYDEDLNILWDEVNEQETKINNYGGTSSLMVELRNNISEIKDILNSFGINSTVDTFLERVSMAADIMVTTEEFETTATTYDEAKLDLERLEKCSISIENGDMITFPNFYSLSDIDKAYMLENNLRKLRRKVITIGS